MFCGSNYMCLSKKIMHGFEYKYHNHQFHSIQNMKYPYTHILNYITLVYIYIGFKNIFYIDFLSKFKYVPIIKNLYWCLG
jgi:hypothetical protein